MDVDAERLEREEELSEDEENAKKREPEKLKTTSAKEAIAEYKLSSR